MPANGSNYRIKQVQNHECWLRLLAFSASVKFVEVNLPVPVGLFVSHYMCCSCVQLNWFWTLVRLGQLNVSSQQVFKQYLCGKSDSANGLANGAQKCFCCDAALSHAALLYVGCVNVCKAVAEQAETAAHP